MEPISVNQALLAAVTASNQVKKNTDVDFSSYLNNEKSLEDIFWEASETYGVSVELLKAMTKQESSFHVNATSRSGAQGLMQLMPATAAELGVTNAYDPYQNIMGGAKYIRQMLDKYDGNVSLALAAYNAGSNNVDRYGGIPPFAETQDYVAKITGYMQEGVEIPDSSTVYTANGTLPMDSDVTYQDLNLLARDILTEIFSYDDYMKYLSKAVGVEENKVLSIALTSQTDEDEDEPSDSYLAYQRLNTQQYI